MKKYCIKTKKLNTNAIIPTQGSSQAAGYDLYACINNQIYIPAHQTRVIPTGIAVELPEGTFGGIYARSGLATKEGLRPANCVGVIDSDYRGEVMVALHNDTDTMKIVDPNSRIAQLIVIPYVSVGFDVVDQLDETDRGDGGFGSTGR